MKDFRFDTICNITQDPHDQHRFKCACFGSIGKSAVIKKITNCYQNTYKELTENSVLTSWQHLPPLLRFKLCFVGVYRCYGGCRTVQHTNESEIILTNRYQRKKLNTR